MPQDAVAMARAYFRAYVEKDRPAIEALLAATFRFTSPRDNRIDRATYFERCWPHGLDITAFDIDQVVPHGNQVFVTYDARRGHGAGFRGCEAFTTGDGQINAVDVYFGWSLPHSAAEGSFLN